MSEAFNAREKQIYAFAKVEAWLEEYARQHDLQARDLASTVATMLMPNGTERTQTRKKVVTHGKKKFTGGPKAYWASMTKEQRSVEMKRRMDIRMKKYGYNNRPKGGVA